MIVIVKKIIMIMMANAINVILFKKINVLQNVK